MTSLALNISAVQFGGIGGQLSQFLRRVIAGAGIKRQARPLAASQTVSQATATGSFSASPKRLDRAAQWARLNDVIGSAVASATSAAEKQVTATQKLDLAQYGLLTLMDDLAAVMTVPGRRERATVVRLAQPAAAIQDQALAA